MEENNGQSSEPNKKIIRRIKPQGKRKKDQLSITIVGIVIYSLLLIFVIAGSYIGFKTFLNRYNVKKAEEEQARLEQARLEEEQREEEKKAEEEKKKAEEDKQKASDELNEDDEGEYTDTVFSVIENVNDPQNAPVNKFNFSRKHAGDEKALDYSIFTNPETNKIEKITTREDCGDLFEITDFYYDDGKVNYVAQYKVDVDVPVDISGADIESRCYFYNDKMVRYIYCENDMATEYSKADFSSYSSGTKEQYNYIENMILDLSKEAYKNAGSLKEEVRISGYILDDYGQIMKDNHVSLIDENSGKVISETYTDGDGYYEFKVSADDYKSYIIRADRETLSQVDVYGIKAPKGSKTVFADTIYMCNEQQVPSLVQIFVKDADDFNKPLAGATIRLRYGINNKTGDSFMTGKLGLAGECVPQLGNGNYTAEITMDGYETCYSSFSIRQDRQAEVFFATKKLEDDEIKCVLSFDSSPLDLDIRCYNSYGRTTYKSVNDSVGAAAAEVIDIKNAGSDAYSVFVSSYADITAMDNFSYSLSKSGAKVCIYNSGGCIGTYPVPEAHAGILWKPVEIRNGRVITTNDFYTNVSDKSGFMVK